MACLYKLYASSRFSLRSSSTARFAMSIAFFRISSFDIYLNRNMSDLACYG